MKGRQLLLFLFFQLSCNFGMIKKGKVILKWHVSPSIRLGQGIVGSWNRPQTQPGGRTQRGQVSCPLSRGPPGFCNYRPTSGLSSALSCDRPLLGLRAATGSPAPDHNSRNTLLEVVRALGPRTEPE